MDNTFSIKNTVTMVIVLMQLCRAFWRGEPGNFNWDDWAFVSRSQLQIYDSSLVMTFLRKSGSLVVVWMKSLATVAQCSFCSVFCFCFCFVAEATKSVFPWHISYRSCIKISNTAVFGIPRSASSSRTGSRRSLIAAHTHSTFSSVLLLAGLPEQGSLSTDSQPSLMHLCHTFISAALIASSLKAFWIIWIVSARGMCKPNAKFDVDLLLN